MQRLRGFAERERPGDRPARDRRIEYDLDRSSRDVRGVECNQPKLILVVEGQAADHEIFVRIGCLGGNVPPRIGVWNLQDRRPQLARIFWIERKIEMLENEIRFLSR